MSVGGVQARGAEPVRVLMLVRELGFGGIERDVSKFSRNFDRNRVQPHVACFRPGGARWHEIESAGVPLIELPVRSFRSRGALSGAALMARYISEHRIDLVHAFDAPSNMFAVPLCVLIGKPVLASSLWLRSMLARSTQYVLAAADRLATGAFVNCHAVANELATEWRYPRRKIHVCHNGYETEQFHPIGRARPLELAGASVVIGAVAALREEKNLTLLVDAFADVVAEHPRTRLLIVGSGDQKDVLVARVAEHGIAHACVFVEGTPNPAEWMRAIDVFVLCSKKEAFSNALLEAMACGCCPVGSRVGGTPELIEHEQRGMLFPSEDRGALASVLRRLVSEDDTRQQFARTASEFARANLTIEIAADRLATIYERVLRRKSAAATLDQLAAESIS